MFMVRYTIVLFIVYSYDSFFIFASVYFGPATPRVTVLFIFVSLVTVTYCLLYLLVGLLFHP